MLKLRLFLLLILITFSFFLYKSYEVKKVPVDIDEKLKSVATKEYMQKNILNSVQNEEEFYRYVDLAKYLNISLDENISILIKEKSESDGFFNNIKRYSKDTYDGFILGEIENERQFYSSMASEFTLVGDVRDFYTEGSKFVRDEEYNRLVFGLAGVGLALGASQIVSLGTTTPLKAGTSILKLSVKSAKLTKSFSQILSKKVSKAVDFSKIRKEISFKSFENIKNSTKIIRKNINIKPLKQITNKLFLIKSNTSLYDTTKLLKYIDNEKDLSKVVKLSSKYKRNSLAVMQVLGKGVLSATKNVVKLAKNFYIYLVGLVFSVLTLVISFIFNSLIRKILF